MIPASRKVLNSRYTLNTELSTVPTTASVAKIAGSVKELGQQYQDAIVILYSKADLQPFAVRKPDINGNYRFLGLNTKLKTFVVAFDKNELYNAVIQDNVVPK